MTDQIATWRDEVTAELTEARAALAVATRRATGARERHQAAVATTAAVKAALARLPELEGRLAQPLSGRVSAAADAVETAAMTARRATFDLQEAAARVERLETAAGQLTAVLAAAAEPGEKAA